MSPKDIQDITIFFPNLLKNKTCQILINHKPLTGVLYLENSILEVENFIGLLLARLNSISLSEAVCSHCQHFHNDNESFSIHPHRKHLCHYCGHEFYVKEANVGNEFISYFTIPEIDWKEQEIKVEETLSLSYDVFIGKIWINDIEGNILTFDKEKYKVYEWVTQVLYKN